MIIFGILESLNNCILKWLWAMVMIFKWKIWQNDVTEEFCIRLCYCKFIVCLLNKKLLFYHPTYLSRIYSLIVFWPSIWSTWKPNCFGSTTSDSNLYILDNMIHVLHMFWICVCITVMCMPWTDGFRYYQSLLQWSQIYNKVKFAKKKKKRKMIVIAICQNWFSFL